MMIKLCLCGASGEIFKTDMSDMRRVWGVRCSRCGKRSDLFTQHFEDNPQDATDLAIGAWNNMMTPEENYDGLAYEEHMEEKEAKQSVRFLQFWLRSGRCYVPTSVAMRLDSRLCALVEELKWEVEMDDRVGEVCKL